MAATAKSTDRSECDVLIVGAGPAGLMLAAWLARFKVNARIVDKRSAHGFYGQADGLNPRTQEIFDSFGIHERFCKESQEVQEVDFWVGNDVGEIVRSNRHILAAREHAFTPPMHSRFRLRTLRSERVGQIMIDDFVSHSNIHVGWETALESFELAEIESNDDSAYPITARLAVVSDGRTEVVHTKFLVGCDGAHSLVRRQIGFTMVGESKDSVFGVIDIIPITNFPGARTANIVNSSRGSVLYIPREGRYVRLYVSLSNMRFGTDGRVVKDGITPDTILADVQQVLSPYTMTYKHLAWWTIYQVGQRVSEHMAHKARVFLAGDAVHTHSPKAGQGMNFSMQDTYNLGWKLGYVIKGLSAREKLLGTYEQERLKHAQELIEFDIKFSALFAGGAIEEIMKRENLKPEQMPDIFQKRMGFSTNLGIKYESDILTYHQKSKADLATNVYVGVRFPSTVVLNHADLTSIELGKRMVADGRFRLLLFAGDLTQHDCLLRARLFAQKLADPTSFMNKYSGTTGNAYHNPLIELITITASNRLALEIEAIPEELRSYDEAYGWAYDRVYTEGERSGQKTFEYLGIDAKRGCVIIVRPDHHVGWLGEAEDVAVMEEYFEGIFQR